MISAIKRYGGKHYLAQRICRMIQPHITYVEPYFGSGAVLFRKDPNESAEVVNDLDGELMNFWTVMREHFDDFYRLICLTPFHEDVFNLALDFESDDPVKRAWAFYIRNRMSRQGLERDFATLTKKRQRGGMQEQVSSYLGSVEQLPEISLRLQRVLVYNRDALDIIEELDSEDTFFYCDPPYLHETRFFNARSTYKYEMSDIQHTILLKTLAGIQGKFILSGYPSVLYYDYAKRFGWKSLTFDVPNSASAEETKELKPETVWYNY
ncbi:MAG: DNA adenine methylase [Patescibacteria group bacterium]|nr:DNA adenine methylase [Patescibacteria group bacterium]MDE2438886.1 DNA adenine methylase [Patescibacteria group bacterium]